MEDPQATRPPRRSVRDWAADGALFLFAVLFGLAEFGDGSLPGVLGGADVVAGVLGCAGVWVRRRWPVGFALVVTLLSAFSATVSGAAVVGMFTVAVHRPARVTAAIGALGLLLVPPYAVIHYDDQSFVVVVTLLAGAIYLAAIGWGLSIRNRRQLLQSLRLRAERADEEARLRAEQAQLRAREQLAREMHDVLGHRLSLLSVHAGALEFRPDAPAEEVARAAGVIRQSAHQALQDLREVIGVLRAPVGELPSPRLADLPELVAESRRAGMRVEVAVEVAEDTVPGAAARTVYRIVQEGLTNARKHAPGAGVAVTVDGGPGAGLTVEVRNSRPDGPPGAGQVRGQGLVGLAERAALTGGRLEYGRTADGGFRVAAWLPWPA
ncbi:sensor histidine kinase [Marinactinospora rubrisoli]|uniref:histidine kinase n=1 Tax=Marinactinospora rubrisoli TaxID=2715399 RepID=A0ABW2KNQ0_9ACTN